MNHKSISPLYPVLAPYAVTDQNSNGRRTWKRNSFRPGL